MADRVEFVFSFRSPYAWMAAHCVLPKLPPDMDIHWLPFYPLPSFPNFSSAPIESKFKYLIRDVTRLTKHYGLTLKFPAAGTDP